MGVGEGNPGALSYFGANHTPDYDLKYNEENKDGLGILPECHGVVEYEIAKALHIGFRLHTLNEAITLMDRAIKNDEIEL
jgi:hypothetical protein